MPDSNDAIDRLEMMKHMSRNPLAWFAGVAILLNGALVAMIAAGSLVKEIALVILGIILLFGLAVIIMAWARPWVLRGTRPPTGVDESLAKSMGHNLYLILEETLDDIPRKKRKTAYVFLGTLVARTGISTEVEKRFCEAFVEAIRHDADLKITLGETLGGVMPTDRAVG